MKRTYSLHTLFATLVADTAPPHLRGSAFGLFNFAAGLAMALLLLPAVSSLAEPYGLLLLAKIAVFALLMALAALNKWRLGPAVAAGSVRGRAAFRLSLAAEWWLIAAVLGITDVMTGFFSP
jgi:copper resistance protein D